MAKPKKNNGIPWFLVVLGFIFHPLIGFILLVLKLISEVSDKPKKANEDPKNYTGNYNYTQYEGRNTTQYTNTTQYGNTTQYTNATQYGNANQSGNTNNTTYHYSFTQNNRVDTSKLKKEPQTTKASEIQQTVNKAGNKGLGFIIAGSIILGLGAVVSLAGFGEAISWIGTEWFMEELWGDFIAPFIGMMGSGAALLTAGLVTKNREHRRKRYKAYIADRKVIDLKKMSKALLVPGKRLVKDLEKMIYDGEFGGAYIDYAENCLVLPGGVIPEKAAPVPKKKPAPKEDKTEYEQILEEIRTLNMDIESPEVSKKIDRIEEITTKIFKEVQERPEKKNQIEKFMKYYLPNTLKMLRAYAKFEEQEVKGDNITSTMQSIEEIMDKLVDGFEKQLDKLFENEAVDIETDITVLEGMLKNDGLDDENDLKLG